MADRYWVGGTANWDGTAGTKWAATSGGTGGETVPTSADNVYFDASSGAVTVTLSASVACANLDFTGFTGTFTRIAGGFVSIYGNLTAVSGMTYTVGTGTTFAATTTGKTITSAGKDLGNLTFNGSGGEWTLQDNLTLGNRSVTMTLGTLKLSTRTFTTTGATTVNGGTLDLGSGTLSTDSFTSDNVTATIAFGTGKIIVTGSGTAFSTARAGSLTITGTPRVEASNTGSVTINSAGSSGGSASTAIDFYATGSGASITLNGHFRHIDFSAVSCTWSNNTVTSYGNLTLGSGTTVGAGNNVFTFAHTSGTAVVTTAGKTIDRPLVINCPGGTVQLADACTWGSSTPATRNTTLTAGTLDLNGQVFTTQRFASSNTNTRVITSGASGGRITVNDTTAATVFNFATRTNLTMSNRSNWEMRVSGNTTNTRTFAGGGATFPTLTFTNTTASGRIDFTGSNTFTSLAYTGGTAQTFGFTAGTTTTIENANGFPSGTSGNIITVTSITAATHTLAKSGAGIVSCNYLSISYSTATPGSTWYAGLTSTDGGNNSGWSFSVPSQPMGFFAPRFI